MDKLTEKEVRFGNYFKYDRKIVFIAGINYIGVRIFNGNGFDKTTPI